MEGSVAYILSQGYTDGEIQKALRSVYKPSGDKTCAQLVSALLIEENLGNVYNITDSGTTTADFDGGAGKPINAGSNVAVVNTGTEQNPVYKFDLLSFSMTTDSDFSTTSENPLQNKVVTHKFSQVDSDISNEITARQALAQQLSHVVSTLDSDISAETSARQSVDQRLSQLISALDTEVDTQGTAISAIQSSLANKVDKIAGKGLSANDFTDTYKNQLDSVANTYQPKTLVTPITVDGVQQTTVEGALGAINNKTVTVDNALSDVSENPVQNKVVKGALDTKQNDVGLSVVNGKLCITYTEA